MSFWWTVLPPLPLIGLSEASVESLDHYVLRLASSCGASLLGIRNLCLSAEGTPLSRSASNLARLPGLEKLTGISLRHGTLWVVSDVLHVRSTYRAGNLRRWCPICYSEWAEGQSREMLIAQLDLCITCPTHRCALAWKCPDCGAAQGASSYLMRRKCTMCKGSLGADPIFPKPDPFGAWLQAQLEELVRFCASPEQPLVHSTNLQTYLTLLVARAASTPRSKTFKRLLSQGRQARGDGRRTLHTLLNACALQGVSVLDALSQPLEAASAPLLDLWDTNGLLPLEAYQQRTGRTPWLRESHVRQKM